MVEYNIFGEYIRHMVYTISMVLHISLKRACNYSVFNIGSNVNYAAYESY